VNSLQIGLIAIGALVVALLSAWYWWQTRRARREVGTAVAATRPVAPQPHHAQPPDAAPEPLARIDHSIDVSASDMWIPDAVVAAGRAALDGRPPEAEASASRRDAPTPDITFHDELPVAAPAPVPAPRPKLQSEWPFDERLHVHASIVSLSGGPFDAAPFVAAAGRAFAWVRLFRQSPWDAFDPTHVGSVQQLVLALPLASRAGPIEAQDIDAWRFVLTELATAQQCEAQFFGFRDGPERAAELDSFLAAVDIIPVAYLVKKDGGHWTGTRLRGTLEANGFRLQSDGRFAYHEVESDAVIFHAVDGYERPFTPERLRTETITALRCMLEPVRLTQPLVRFDMFRQSLRALSKLLDADLKTSEGEVLDETRFAAMRDEVKTAMEAIAGAGIDPGSDTARSLFG
jgi:hypothetical protein